MAIITLVCEHCGGKITVDDSHEFGICKSCKSNVLIKPDTIVQNFEKLEKHVYGYESKGVEELVADGNNLLNLGDEKKANEKFRQAIEVEPNSWEAWYGYATTGGDRTGYISCVPAFRKAYNAATDVIQEISTFNEMTRFLPDRRLGEALSKACKAASSQKRHEMFDLVVSVIGRDDSEVAKLAIDLCPNDWRAWFAQAQIRQIRVKWTELEGGFLTGKRLSKDATDVLNIFFRAYQLAKNESTEAKNIVISHISTMECDQAYNVFVRELNNLIRREG